MGIYWEGLNFLEGLNSEELFQSLIDGLRTVAYRTIAIFHRIVSIPYKQATNQSDYISIP